MTERLKTEVAIYVCYSFLTILCAHYTSDIKMEFRPMTLS